MGKKPRCEMFAALQKFIPEAAKDERRRRDIEKQLSRDPNRLNYVTGLQECGFKFISALGKDGRKELAAQLSSVIVHGNLDRPKHEQELAQSIVDALGKWSGAASDKSREELVEDITGDIVMYLEEVSQNPTESTRVIAALQESSKAIEDLATLDKEDLADLDAEGRTQVAVRLAEFAQS